MGKRGASGMYMIILSLILGVLVLVISLVFNEAIFDKDGDREVCAQSIQVRASLPSAKISGIVFADFKDEYPLKCQTNVIEIDRGDVRGGEVEAAQRKIAEAMAECWYLYGKGDYSVFPGGIFKSSNCVPCARIHLTEDAKKELGGKNISIKKALDLPMKEGFTYYNYLQNSGDKFSAFNFGNGLKFNLDGDVFKIGKTYDEEYEDSFKEKLMERKVEVRIADSKLEVVFDGWWFLDTVLGINQLSLVNIDEDVRNAVYRINKSVFDKDKLNAVEYDKDHFCGDKEYDKECFVVEKYLDDLGNVDSEMLEDGNKWSVSIVSKTSYSESENEASLDIPSIELINRINGENITLRFVSKNVSLPANFDPSKGDLLINYGAVTVNGGDFGEYIPYLFYFQTGQKNPNSFSEVNRVLIFDPLGSIIHKYTVSQVYGDNPAEDVSFGNVDEKDVDDNSYAGLSFCSLWDGIPA